MKIALITRSNATTWGGDLKALYAIQEGCRQLRHEVLLVPPFDEHIKTCDFAFITNTCLDQRDNHKWLKQNSIPFGAICFHEDFQKYLGYCKGLSNYYINALRVSSNTTLQSTINHLYRDPELVRWYTRVKWDPSVNYEILKNAKVCIANSEVEAKTIQRDCPEAKTKVVFWTPGMADEWNDEISDSFLSYTGLAKKEYILQVGRLEPRKNQISTLIACQNQDLPLVFIATQGHFTDYEEAFIQIASRLRKKRTLLITDKRLSARIGTFDIIQMPKGEKLSSDSLKSAYQHARLHIHPAFYELPGYTYFESIKYGIPTLASEWASIKDYFNQEEGGHTLKGLVRYASPYHLQEIEASIEALLKVSSIPPKLHIFNRKPIDVAREIVSAIE